MTRNDDPPLIPSTRAPASSQVARHIARAAARLFASQGYDATSVRTIVEAAGVTKPTLYYYFGSKQGLAQALLTDPLDGLLERLRALAAEPGNATDRLIEAVEAHFAFCREDPDRARFVYALSFGPLATGLANEIERIGDALSLALTSVASRLATEGVIEPERLAPFILACRGMIVVATVDFLYKGLDLGPDLASALVRDLLHGFAREPRNTVQQERA